MIDRTQERKGWDKFFLYLHRLNAVLLIVILALFGFVAVQHLFLRDDWRGDFENYESGFDQENETVEGNIIETSDGQVVSYLIEPMDKDGRDISGRNLSLTHMKNGKTLLLLPDGSDQIILNWEQLEKGARGTKALSVLLGTEQDYQDGMLDWTVVRLSDLEKTILAERVRYIDAPQMIDDDTMSVIVWTTPDVAEFWLIDLSSLSIISKRPVSLPLPEDRDFEAEIREMADAAAEGAAAAAQEASR